MSRVACHAEAEGEIEASGEDVASHHDRWTGPDWIFDRIVHGFKKIGRAHERNKRRVHEQANEIVDDAWYYQGQRLRQYDKGRHARIVQSERHCGFVLSPPQRLNTAA